MGFGSGYRALVLYALSVRGTTVLPPAHCVLTHVAFDHFGKIPFTVFKKDARHLGDEAVKTLDPVKLKMKLLGIFQQEQQNGKGGRKTSPVRLSM